MTIIGKEGLRSIAPRTVEVEVPELGGAIRVRRLSASENARIAQMAQAAQAEGKNDPILTIEMLAEMVTMAWVDERGVRVVDSAEDRKALTTELSLETLERITDAIGSISGMGKKAAEDAAKNS